jgi:hypothetical protein
MREGAPEGAIGAEGADDGEGAAVRAEEVARGGANGGGIDAGDVRLGVVDGEEVARADQLFAEPHHAVFGVFEGKIDLAEGVVAHAPEFSSADGSR